MSDKMTGAPERIWVHQCADQYENPISTQMLGSSEDYIEYVRADLFAAMAVERDALRAALNNIDAVDPEAMIDGFSEHAINGLVHCMGAIARKALGAS